MIHNFRVRSIDADATLPIRHAVLRKGLPIETARYPQDGESVHLGCFHNEELVGVASYCDENFESKPAVRLRGMAVIEGAQGQGVGRALVLHAIEECISRGVARMWCTARTSAQAFYEGLGFVAQGPVFEVEGHGPHVLMSRPLK